MGRRYFTSIRFGYIGNDPGDTGGVLVADAVPSWGEQTQTNVIRGEG